MSSVPTDYATLATLFTDWWRGLQSLDKNGKSRLIAGQPMPPDRKALAELRRINVIDEAGQSAVDIGRALSIPAFRDLIGRLGAKDNDALEPSAIAAATLARVRTDTNSRHKAGTTARLLGATRSGEADGEPLYAEPRFKRLLRSRDDPPDLLAQARRVAAILEREAPIGDLAASLVLWNARPDISNPIRRDWAFQYYQRDFTAVAEPDATQSAVTI
jgi:CRISPR type I-E-associated protein CasB/Cse2